MRATEYGLLHYGNYSFTDIKSNIYAFNNEISVVNDETNENESSAYTEIIYVEIESNDGNPNEFKLAEDGEILDYREGNYILNSNVIPAMEVSDSATVFLQTLSIQARICKFGEKYFALVTKNMAGAVAWETFLGGLEIVATQMKKKKREKITLLNDILREKQLSVVLFISKDGALLETAYQSIDNLYGNEIVLFIETNDSMNLFGSVIRIKTGANVSSSSGVPYKKLSKVVDYFNTNVSSSALQEIIKEHIADKSSGFFIVKRAFLGALNRVVRFSSDLTLEGIGKISDGIGELVGALKLDDSQWQYYDDNGLPLKNANLFLPGLGSIKYLQEANKKGKPLKPEQTNAKAINKITELEKILKESKKTIGKADFFKKIINQLLYMLRKVKDFLGDPLGKALDFAETAFVLYNAYIVGIINSIVDAIKGIFDILSIICKALAALQKKGKNIAENLPSYLSLFFEIIENMVETLENLFSKENLKALIEFFTKSAAFILTLPTRAFAWLTENAAMPNLDKVAYYYGYIIGFIIQLILEILFTGGAKTAADAFKKLADSLINIFKTMEKFVFKFSDKVVIGFENLLAIFAYIREKSKNLGVFLENIFKWLNSIFRNDELRVFFQKFDVELKKVATSSPLFSGVPVKLEDGVYALLKDGIEIFRGSKKEINALAKKLENLSDNLAEEYLEILRKENRLIREKQIVFDGQTWSWTNPSNVTLRWSALSKEVIIKNIHNAFINVGDKGKIFEAKVAKKIAELVENAADEITDFSNSVLNKKSRTLNGDIDCATKKYIIEAKSGLHNEKAFKELKEQLEKYLPENIKSTEKFMNPLGKKVVVVYEDLGNFTLNHPILKGLEEKGVIFIKGINNLKKLY
jgi:hypothetical protein